MLYIKQFTEINRVDVYTAGGKGASLGEMTQAGIPVPKGFVLTANAYDRFLYETNIWEQIDAHLKEIKIEDMDSVHKISEVIRDLIHRTEIPKDIVEEISDAARELDASYVAVRSSATAEDSANASWAGELETYLNIVPDQIVEKVRQCWSSLYTPRAIFYRSQKNLLDKQVSVAVVIQNMIQSEVSGVMFTVHPVAGDRNRMIIEAGLGLGEAIVSGRITPDSYIVDKRDYAIIDISIYPQTLKLVMSSAGKEVKNIWEDACLEGMDQKLSNEQIVELAQLGERIERHYGFPCDVEWVYSEGEFYITQSRPITTLYR